MESFLASIEWAPVIVSVVITYLLGWLWYSPKMFYEKWRAGKGSEVVQHPMWMPMAAQLGATFLLAIIVNLSTADGHVGHSILVGLTIGGFIKANGLYGGKTKYAISVEVVYVLVMVAVMIAINQFM